MEKLKVLVLGDGLLGSELVRQTGWDYISRKKDGLDIDKIEEFLNNRNYLVIINCIANTNTYSTDKNSHWKVNVEFLDRLIDYCNKNNTKLVHISTDYIYTGSINNASENDVPVHCNNWYGYTKLVGDALVQLRAHKHLVIRCTHKPNPFPYDAAWIDQVGNFDYVNVIANLIKESINQELVGLYNIGTDVKTMHELAEFTKPFVSKSFAPAHVPHNTTMDITKFKNKLKWPL